MGRSIKVDPEQIETVQQALRQSSYPSQSALAIDVGLTRPTVNNFFNGKPIDYLNFVEICQRLHLDWQAIAARETKPESPEETFLEVAAVPTIPDILVVDDRPDNIRLLSNMLTEQGYKVRKAVTGFMALTAAQTIVPDLILLDITMPQMDGYEVCQRLKSSPKTKDVPVIFISALDEAVDKVKAFNQGGADYITKPFQVDEVIARVELQLTICRLKRQLQEQNRLLQEEIDNRREVDQVIQEQNLLLQREVQNRLKTEKLLKEQNLLLESEIQTRLMTEYNLQEKNILLQKEISDRLTIAKHLEDKKQQLATLISNIPGVIYRAISHSDNRVSMPYVSPRIKELVGLSVSEFLETFEWIFDVVHPEDRTDLYQALEEAKFYNRQLDHQYRLAHNFGSTRWARILAHPHILENHDIVWDGVIIDISQQKNMEIAYEMLLESMEMDYRQSEALLQNLFPHEISQHLKQTKNPIACAYEFVSVMFADIVGFTQVCSHLLPEETVELLNRIFSSFDQLTFDFGLEKIKTIGDQYMVVGGISPQCDDHIEAIADLALKMQEEIQKFSDHQGYAMNLRIGINAGSVVAGVIGTNKFVYDIWGDSVNIASRMESQGEAGLIQVTDIIYKNLGDRYLFEPRGEILIKGKGQMPTYWLLGKAEI